MSKIDIAKQTETISRLRSELARLNRQFDESKKALGLSDEELRVEEKDLPADVRQAMQAAKDAAEKAARNAVASLNAEATPASSVSSARLRRGMAI